MRRIVISVVIAALSLIATVSAEQSASAPTNQGPSVRQYVTPDGRIDVNAVRASGYQGPLDLKGIDVRVDPRGGAPMVSAGSAQSPADDPDDIYWDNSISPSIPGVDGEVRCATEYNGRLIVGGTFKVAGGVIANHIAAWDGNTWSALDSGTNDWVYGLTVYDGKLIAAGPFTTAGGTSANHVAAWNGSSWSALGAGILNGGVFAIGVYSNKLIVGGNFTLAGGTSASGIAAWDGNAWSALGAGMDNAVTAITVFDGKLIAGGGFKNAGGASASFVAAWDGAAWSAMGSGIYDGYGVSAFTNYDGKLIAGGAFDSAGSVEVRNIAAWDGSSWSALGSGMNSYVYACAVYDNKLVAGGYFTMAGGLVANHVALWDGSSWSTLGSGTTGNVFALNVFNSVLFAGGGFTTSGGVMTNNIASWDGSAWSQLGAGISGAVRCLIVYDNKLVAGGDFTSVEGIAANHIAIWNGGSWSALGIGTDSSVYTLSVFEGKLIAGGAFSAAGGSSANHIAPWDGASWSPLGSGTDGPVNALAVYDGKLIAGGTFTIAGGNPASNIASWDGINWSPLGSGRSKGVSALTLYDGKLAAGAGWLGYGRSDTAVASWNGITWSEDGLPNEFYFDGFPVQALTAYNNKLIAGGSRFACYIECFGSCQIASWDGSYWSLTSVGYAGEYGLESSLNTFTIHENDLVAGGSFDLMGEFMPGGWQGGPANCVASWDGFRWSPLGSGVALNSHYPSVSAATVYRDKLIVGGDFSTAGGKVAANLAIWTRKKYAGPVWHVEENGNDWSGTGSANRPFATINLAIRKASSGDTVLVGSGNYANWPDTGVDFAGKDIVLTSASGPENTVISCRARAFAFHNGETRKAVVRGFTIRNSESGGGGLNWIDCRSASPTIEGNVFTNDDYYYCGFNMYFNHSSARLIGNTFSGFGCRYTGVLIRSDSSSITIENCIIAQNLGRAIQSDESVPAISGTDIFANEGGDWIDNISSQAGINGNMSLNPQFCDTGSENYHLAVSSPCAAPNNEGVQIGALDVGCTVADVADDRSTQPASFALVQNYPNPFNPSTSIEYSVPARTRVTVEIFNLLGQQVTTLVDEMKNPGKYKTEWDGGDVAGKPVSTGVYLYRFKAGDFVESKKMLLLK